MSCRCAILATLASPARLSSTIRSFSADAPPSPLWRTLSSVDFPNYLPNHREIPYGGCRHAVCVAPRPNRVWPSHNTNEWREGHHLYGCGTLCTHEWGEWRSEERRVGKECRS